MLKPLLVLCLGNEIISDDSFGPVIARRLQPESEADLGADIVFAPVAGFYLLDFMAGRRAVLIVDTIRTGKAEPGTLHTFPAGVLTPSKNLTTSHQINLPTAMALGKQMGLELPECIDVIAVEALDLETLSEEMTPPVQAAVEDALKFIRRWIVTNSFGE